jgi:hypothetical protein
LAFCHWPACALWRSRRPARISGSRSPVSRPPRPSRRVRLQLVCARRYCLCARNVSQYFPIYIWLLAVRAQHFQRRYRGGYKVNNYFRTDLVLDYRSQIHAIGSGAAPCFTNVSNPPPTRNPVPANCVGHFDSEIRRWDLLANAYLALGTWDGFTPYINQSIRQFHIKWVPLPSTLRINHKRRQCRHFWRF